MEEQMQLFKEPELRKKDGFYGDRCVVLSKKQLESVKSNPITKDLYITDIGFYPFAKNHFRKRENGIDEQILIYCVDGSGTIQVEEKTFQLHVNNYLIIEANKKHQYWSSEKTPWSIYWVHFGGEHSKCFKDFFNRVIKIDQMSSSRKDDRLKLFHEILTALESLYTNENLYFANMCFHRLLASFFYNSTYRVVKGYRSSDPVDKSISYMHKNLNKLISIETFANHVQLSESHFSKVFRNKTGTSPLNYFINMKMQEAIRLMTNQSLKIKEVAFKLGYNDPYYFTRVFTRHMGSSPASYIKTRNR